MSDEDPWKNWYQAEQPPSGAPGYDATQDVSFSSRMPPSSGNGPGAGQGSWPAQPPPVSPSGGGGSAYGNPGYRGNGNRAPYGGSTYGGAPTRGDRKSVV